MTAMEFIVIMYHIKEDDFFAPPLFVINTAIHHDRPKHMFAQGNYCRFYMCACGS